VDEKRPFSHCMVTMGKRRFETEQGKRENLLFQTIYDMVYQNMEKAKIRSEHIFLFSATRFEPMLAEHAKTDDRFELIDMNEL